MESVIKWQTGVPDKWESGVYLITDLVGNVYCDFWNGSDWGDYYETDVLA